MSNKRGFISKRGQVTLFIIIAIVIVALVVALYYFNGGFKFTKSSTGNPKYYIEECISQSIQQSEKDILDGNGYTNFTSNNYALYEKEKIPYMCSVSEFYSPCIPQDPTLFLRIEREIRARVNSDLKVCLKKLYSDLNDENYNVESKSGFLDLKIKRDGIFVNFNETIYFSKNEESYSLAGFEVLYGTNLYDMINLEQTIVNYETLFCEFNKNNWMNYNNDIIISTTRTSDQTKIYTLRDRLTEREIKFAIKTCVFPAGI